MTHIISNIFRSVRRGDLRCFGTDRMADVFAFAYRIRHSICEGMGTRHNNYVGSFFARRPRAHFTRRGEQNHTYSVCLRPPWNPAAQIFLLVSTESTASQSVLLICGRSIRSFLRFAFFFFELALSLHDPPQCSVSNELDIKRFSLPMYFIPFPLGRVLHILQYYRET